MQQQDLNSSFNSLSDPNRGQMSRSFVGGNGFLDNNSDDDEDNQGNT
jgi:hypothetical protein